MRDPKQPHFLRRIDTNCNMAKFYVLTIEPTLFGGASMLRHWGRIGTRGRQMVELFDNPSDAAGEMTRLATYKLKRGYDERG